MTVTQVAVLTIYMLKMDINKSNKSLYSFLNVLFLKLDLFPCLHLLLKFFFFLSEMQLVKMMACNL